MKYFKVFEMSKFHISDEEIVEFFINLNKKVSDFLKKELKNEITIYTYDDCQIDMDYRNYDKEQIKDQLDEYNVLKMEYYSNKFGKSITKVFTFIDLAIDRTRFIIIEKGDTIEEFPLNRLSNIEKFVMNYLEKSIKKFEIKSDSEDLFEMAKFQISDEKVVDLYITINKKIIERLLELPEEIEERCFGRVELDYLRDTRLEDLLFSKDSLLDDYTKEYLDCNYYYKMTNVAKSSKIRNFRLINFEIDRNSIVIKEKFPNPEKEWSFPLSGHDKAEQFIFDYLDKRIEMLEKSLSNE